MILPCDVIVAARSAKFGMAFVRMGVVPELASSHFLVQRMGLGRASEMCLTGRLYSGAEAYEMGLVDRLVDDADLLTAAGELAASMAANPAPQLRWVKELLTRNGSETDLALVQQREMELLVQAYASPEHKEAVAAFLEKRQPDYRRAAKEG
jgi:enoyl-CoA hydratase/carnithine racemase